MLDAEADALARVPVALDDISDSTLGIAEEEIITLRDGVDAKCVVGTDAGTLLSGVLDIFGTGVPRSELDGEVAGRGVVAGLVGADTEAGVIGGTVRAFDGMLLPGMTTATNGFVTLSTEILGLLLGETTSTGLVSVTPGVRLGGLGVKEGVTTVPGVTLGDGIGTLGLRDGVTETGGLGLIETTDDGGGGIELGVDGETTSTGGEIGVPEDTELEGVTAGLGEVGLKIGPEVEGVTTGADVLGLDVGTETELFDGVTTTTTLGIDELLELNTLGEETKTEDGVTLTDGEKEKLLLERLDVLDNKLDVLDDDVTVGLRTIEEVLEERSSERLELDELEIYTLLLLYIELLVEVIGTELELFDMIVTPQMASVEYVVVQSVISPRLAVAVTNPPKSAIIAPTLTGGK